MRKPSRAAEKKPERTNKYSPMKKKISLLFLLAIGLFSSCSVFKPGCGCPKVTSAASVFDKTSAYS